MAAKTFLNLPGGVKMPALGLGTFDVSLEHRTIT
jgi:diketogulonate reductase-like aldo/keto reductase